MRNTIVLSFLFLLSVSGFAQQASPTRSGIVKIPGPTSLTNLSGTDLVSNIISADAALGKRVMHVFDVSSLTATSGVAVASVNVRDQNRGGLFFYASSGYTANSGTVFPASGSGFWVRQDQGPVNPKWFGCKGDSLTDDTANLQLAFNNPGPTATVYVPAGTYRITDHLIIPDGVIGRSSRLAHLITPTEFTPSTVRGNDGTYAFLPGNGSQLHDFTVDLKNTGTGGISVIQVNSATIRGCTVKNMIITGARFGIALVGGDHHHVENNVILDVAHGINIFRSDYSTITGNVTNRTFSGIYTVASNHCHIELNTTENCADVGIDVERSQHTYVRNNHAAFCKNGEFSLYDGGAENSGQLPQLDVVFSDNTAHRASSYIVANPTGATSTTAACDAGLAAYTIASIVPGATGIVFENNKAQVDYGYGFYHTQLSGAKTARTVYFRNNIMYSAAGFLSMLDNEGVTIADNLFVGLPGSESVTNVIREGHGLVFTGNTFRYINTKTTNYAINQFTSTGYATVAPYYARNNFINCGVWAFQVDSFQNSGLTPILQDNSLSTLYVANGGLNITGNGPAKLIDQNLKILLPTGTTNVGGISGVNGAAWGKAFGSLSYGRVGYNGLAATLVNIYGSAAYLTVLNTVNGLSATVSGSNLTLSDGGANVPFAYWDAVVNSY